MSDRKDSIYLHEQPHVDFVFDQKVADVFGDMITRSVPGYATIISMIGVLSERYAQPDSLCFDLGCSLGAATVAMRHHITRPGCRIVAVDSSQPMINRCRQIMEVDTAGVPVDVVCGDLFDTEICNASVVVLNFTLQFVPPGKRQALIDKVFAGLLPGGLLILSEKICFEDTDLNELFIDMYHRFKSSHGYSELEISRKRAALENVLIPETIAVHEKRMSAAGFSSFDVWFQCFNFASMVAVKGR
ncbi:MAG: carboxy-S-adenosyl-L-methionine synthase CmoA [Pseudohongiellaceae bacterium]